MKKLGFCSIVLVICILFSACGSKGTEHNSVYSMPQASYDGKLEYSALEDKAEYGLGYVTNTSGTVAEVPMQTEKLVYRSRISLEADDFDSANDALHSKIKSLGGIIVSENAYNLNSKYRSVDITVRIPQEKYDEFMSSLSESCNVVDIQNTVDNMTEQYYDNANRLRSYRIQEERLFAMLEKAETVEDMLEIESRLCDVQYHIERLTNANNTIDNDVKYATFSLHLSEVTKYTAPTPKTFGDRFSEAIKESGEDFTEFLEGLLFVVIYLAPYLVIITVVLIIVVASVKRKTKKRKNAEKSDK